MAIDSTAVTNLCINYVVKDWLRIFDVAHITTPLGAGYGSSRFSSPTNSFKVIYIAETLLGAIAETIVRDRFEGCSPSDRVIDISEIEANAIAQISTDNDLTKPATDVELNLLDLRTLGAVQLGIDTDATGAKAHAKGQEFSEELYSRFIDVDGILFLSRLTKSECVAVYDRAFSKLIATQTEELKRVVRVPDALSALSLVLVIPPTTP